MKQIVLITGGSRGDVQPYIALGKGLRAAGFAVRLLGGSDFESLATEAGLAFGTISGSMRALIESQAWQERLSGGNFLKILHGMQSEMKKQAAQVAEVLPDLMADADLVIAGMAGWGGGFAIAEHYHIPMIQAHILPITPTTLYPAPLLPNLAFTSLYPFSFWLTQQLLWQSTKASDTAVRRKLGLSRESFFGPFRRLAQMKIPELHGYSPHILPRSESWDALHHVTGYWFLEAADNWEPSPELQAFLEAGPAPVYIGFGSMGNRNPEEAGQIALEALAQSGQRGIIAQGWGGLSVSDLPDSVLMVSSLPHSWLFPRLAAVVHHGGAGTTAAGLRAGVPSLVIPFMGDQSFWGKRLYDLGVGPAPIPRKKLNSAKLAEAIGEAVANQRMRQRAQALGEKIRAEDGVATAVKIIEQAMYSQMRTQPIDKMTRI